MLYTSQHLYELIYYMHIKQTVSKKFTSHYHKTCITKHCKQSKLQIMMQRSLQVKIGQLDSEILMLEIKNKKRSAKYSHSGKFAERAILVVTWVHITNQRTI